MEGRGVVYGGSVPRGVFCAAYINNLHSNNLPARSKQSTIYYPLFNGPILMTEMFDILSNGDK